MASSSYYQHQPHQYRQSSNSFYHGLAPRDSDHSSNSHTIPPHRSAAQNLEQEQTDYCTIQDGRDSSARRFITGHGLRVPGDFGTAKKVPEGPRRHGPDREQAGYDGSTCDTRSQWQPERPASRTSVTSGHRQSSLRVSSFGLGIGNGLGTPLRPHTPSAPTGRIWPGQQQPQDFHAHPHTPPFSHSQLSSSFGTRAASPAPCPPEFKHLRVAASSPAKKGYPTPARPPAVFGPMGEIGLRTGSPGPVPRYITPGPEQWQSHRSYTPAVRGYGQDYTPAHTPEPQSQHSPYPSKVLSSAYLTPATVATGITVGAGVGSSGYGTALMAGSYSGSSSEGEYDIDASDDSLSEDDYWGVDDDRRDGQERWAESRR